MSPSTVAHQVLFTSALRVYPVPGRMGHAEAYGIVLVLTMQFGNYM